jgi:sugar transferase (PEP-CTERM/EpsH1 system associated)
MKLCWIKAGGFVPLDFGGRIRSFQMVKELARRHQVTVLTFYPAVENDLHPTIAPLFEELITVPLRLPKQRSVGEYIDYLGRLLAPHPYSMQKYYRPELRRAVAELFSRKSFDAIICDFVYPAGVLDWNAETPIVLFTHNVEAEVWERQYRLSTNPIRKLMFWTEYRRLTHSERYYSERAASVCAVSESNRQFFGAYVGGAENVTLLPTGVDTDYFQPTDEPPRPRTLVFTGSMDWVPNHDAIDYFYREILPLIRAEEPDVETWVVGRNPSDGLRKLVKDDPKVHLTGRVDDVRPYMNQGSIYILPMRTGSGTRLKVFEAMASGKAIVSTSVGAEGLPVTDGENILLADDPAKFAEAVIQLMRDDALRQRLERSARVLAENGFSWRIATQRLEEAIMGTAKKSADTRLQAQ